MEMIELNTSMDGLTLQDMRQDNGLIDITDIFMQLGGRLKPETIVKDSKFNLFEGTHSLEVNNEKLDSTLIRLSENELNFKIDVAYGEELDSSSTDPTKLDYVTAIADRLARSIISWLNDYQSLPTTVLSCRYVEYALYYNMNDPDMNDDSINHIETGDPLYDQVLDSLVVGICYFLGFVYKVLSAGVIYEEEDLNFNHMGLNNFQLLPDITSILSQIKQSRRYLSSIKEEHPDLQKTFDRLLSILVVIENLISIEKIIDSSSEEAENSLNEMESAAHELVLMEPMNNEPPLGAFSIGIQRRLSNQFPPRKIITPSYNYNGFLVISKDVKLVNKIKTLTSAREILSFATFFNKLSQKHVLSRALFSLILVKQDQSVLGNFSAFEFWQLHVNEFTGIDFCSNLEIDSDMEMIFQEASNVLLEFYQNAAQNTCRYRQGFNRQILLWDSLQAQLEAQDANMRSTGKYTEETVESISTSIYLCSSWVYVMKLLSMTEFILKGFELDIYKPYESYTMYWYCYYLQIHLNDALERLKLLITDKISAIQALNKKMKKLKAGEKKEKVRKQYREAMDNDMPNLRTALKNLETLIKRCNIHKSMCLSEVLYFAILRSFGLIDAINPTQVYLSNDKLIHDLRLKTFSSIGVPELPSYKIFQKTLNDFTISEPLFELKLDKTIECIRKELDTVDRDIASLLDIIETEEENDSALLGCSSVKEEACVYYESIRVSLKGLLDGVNQFNKGKTLKKLQNQKIISTLENIPNGSPYYRLIVVNEKKSIKPSDKK
ncbi:N-alpha-acetyltransferase 35, NatC auxiliary subunit [Nakaseomyces bracarensis]|uniref:N-alpha-acetyltransferase 35, NatC auxiliary subunit n=1 Tax=Nakaseomyces bracarensis TaxID=273131 RepID=A0ABR4NTE7_9SACH